MSFFEGPKPVDSTTVERLAENSGITPLQDESGQERFAQDVREADQNLREASQDLREASQDFQISGEAVADIAMRYQLLVDSVIDYAIYMLDPEGRVVTWNVGAERSKGYKAEEILGQNYSIFFTPEDVEAGLPAQELAEAMREGRYEAQVWRLRKDGTKFWANVTMTAIRGAEGELLGFAKITRDMTAKRAAEEELHIRNAQLGRYRMIIESVTDHAIFTLDAEGRIDSWSAGARKVYDYRTEEVLGREYSLAFSPEDIEAGKPQQEMEAAARNGHCATEDWRMRRDGTRIWVSGALTAVRDEVGKLTGYIRVARDMTAQKKAEEALLELNRQLKRYRIIVENISDYMIYTLDAEGRIDSWSSGLQELLGYTTEEVLGREYSMVFTAIEIESGEPQRELDEAAWKGRCAADGWRVRRDGTIFWSSGVLTAVRDETGQLTGYIRVARDTTLQKRLEESLTKMSAELELRVEERTRELEATVEELRRKNVEVEAFVHIVSHDLRAPLVNVQGFVRELEDSGKRLKGLIQTCPNWEQCCAGVRPILDEEIGDALHYISASTTKFERLINALLSLSRQGRQVYQMARLNVWELVTNSLATFQQAISEAGAEVEIMALPAVTADATALGQVFSNLIGNALKYRSPKRKLQIEIGGQVEGDLVHYWVRDNGLGIPEFGKTKLFQVFQRFHRERADGEGMGLAIVHRIVDRHGGKIWAESREDAGTTFHFSLPGTPESAGKVSQRMTDHELN